MTESPVIMKKDKRWMTKRSKLRRKSVSVTEAPVQQSLKPFNASLHTASRTNIGPDQTAKIQAAAAALRQQKTDAEYAQPRRGKPREHASESKTNSVFTLQPVIMSEASPAMKWANRYDRDNLRDAYLKGLSPSEKKAIPDTERSLPPIPTEETVQPRVEAVAATLSHAPAKNNAISLPIEAVRQQSAPVPSSNSGRSSPGYGKRMSMSPNPVHPTSSNPEKGGKKVSRLRAIFGMKAEGSQPPVVGGGQLIVPLNDVERKHSLRRKQPPTELKAPAQQMTSPTAENPISPALEKETAPAYSVPPAPEQHPALAKQSFSGFDQGPLDDQPAFVPEDSSEVLDLDTPAHSPAPFKDDPSVLLPSASGASEPAVQDRWAQIRKNAAERAKANKTTDDVSATTTTTDARGSLDDGETSGEESKLYY
jgi:hypothetical protein